MALFGRSQRVSEPAQARKLLLGSGRRLKSSLDTGRSVRVLGEVVAGYRESPYRYMPQVFQPGAEWLGQGRAPDSFVAFDDIDGFLIVVAIWRLPAGSEFALFPLGSGDTRLDSLPVIGYWKRLDSSLSSIGTAPANSARLVPPPIPSGYLEDILQIAGYQRSGPNLTRLNDQATQMFLLKAHQFISNRDARQASAFIDRWRGSSPEQILNALGAWDPAVLPYIQDTPGRIKGLLLQSTVDGTERDTFWSDLVR